MNCIPYNYDITIQEGGTYDKMFKWSVGITPVSLVGFIGKMQGRKKLTDTETLVNLPSIIVPWVADGNSGIYILDDGITPDLAGTYRMYIKDDYTQGLCANHKDIIGVYDLYLYNSSHEAVLRQYGIMTIEASATRWV